MMLLFIPILTMAYIVLGVTLVLLVFMVRPLAVDFFGVLADADSYPAVGRATADRVAFSLEERGCDVEFIGRNFFGSTTLAYRSMRTGETMRLTFFANEVTVANERGLVATFYDECKLTDFLHI